MKNTYFLRLPCINFCMLLRNSSAMVSMLLFFEIMLLTVAGNIENLLASDILYSIDLPSLLDDFFYCSMGLWVILSTVIINKIRFHAARGYCTESVNLSSLV